MKHLIGVAVLVIIGLVLLVESLYTLNEAEQAVITQFGKPVGDPITVAGLHTKTPFIQDVHVFTKRILTWDGAPEQITSEDKKYLWMDTTARLRIVDPLQFYLSVKNTRTLFTLLDDILDGAARNEVTDNLLIEVVRNTDRELPADVDTQDEVVGEDLMVTLPILVGRDQITHNIRAAAAQIILEKYGVDLVDVQIQRLNYIDEVRQKVYERMIAERQRIAARYRSEGEGSRAQIRGMKERELKQITSEAYKIAQGIKGEADATSTKVYAGAYNLDPDFYAFLKALESYEATIGKNSTLILTTDSDLYGYLKSAFPG